MTAAADVEVELEGRRLRLTSLDRVMWPRTGFTKGQMISYYREVGPALVPHVAGRPVTLGRLPEGVEGPGWYQTNCRQPAPWMRTARVAGRGGEPQEYCVIDDVPALLWVANLGTIELHPLLAEADAPDRPLVVVFDLDPGPPAGIVEACRVALMLRAELEQRGFTSLAKTSGSKGVHVYVPLNADERYERTKPFAREIAATLAERHPDQVVPGIARAERAGLVFFDWAQNDPVRSTVAPYSLRAAPTPKVSTPITWEEVERAVETGDAESLRFEPRRVLDRLEKSGDVFEPILRIRQSLPKGG